MSPEHTDRRRKFSLQSLVFQHNNAKYEDLAFRVALSVARRIERRKLCQRSSQIQFKQWRRHAVRWQSASIILCKVAGDAATAPPVCIAVDPRYRQHKAADLGATIFRATDIRAIRLGLDQASGQRARGGRRLPADERHDRDRSSRPLPSSRCAPAAHDRFRRDVAPWGVDSMVKQANSKFARCPVTRRRGSADVNATRARSSHLPSRSAMAADIGASPASLPRKW